MPRVPARAVPVESRPADGNLPLGSGSEVAFRSCIYYFAAMIPRLAPDEHLPALYQTFLNEVAASGFVGEVHTDYATRLVTATDNSVYQIIPLAVLYPRSEEDICRVLRLAAQERFHAIKLSPRGGGTGTNGQSLCDGIILDVSKHFRAILEVNLEEGWVRVQPGVILDQLNAHLAPHGVFFAPNLSPSSRATIGGMINTDACGKGSRVYGKTSEHVVALRSVLLDGSVLETSVLSEVELEKACSEPSLAGKIYQEVRAVVDANAALISRDLPRMKRFLTGYDLKHVRTADGKFDLSRVIAGSEGTLVVLTEAKIRLTPIPKRKKLVAIRYSEFDAALRAANRLVERDPGAIETVDDTIVGLAREDVIWHTIAHLVEADGEPPAAAINLVEFESDDPDVVEAKTSALIRQLDEEKGKPNMATGYAVASTKEDIAALWSLRKKGVGLLGNVKGERRPVPFVEDTAVPPENLADYIKEFREILDRRGLRYGMFGHVDVGCLHVRPALNLRDPDDEKMLRGISDEVVALVKKHGGVLWGEHGRGYRSEYTPTFFGDELYAELRRVKGVFDPHNQLNPGKLATPAKSTDKLVSVDAMKRGAYDRQIPDLVRRKFAKSVDCNGNGACFDWNPDSVMCPSSKVTGERIHSPKGRAGILREWLRLVTQEGHDVGAYPESDEPPLELLRGRDDEQADFSHQVYDAMNGCLACKACATQCPIKVDIPHMRSEFLEHYHGRYRRPLKDYFVAALEFVLRFLVLFPRFSNWLMGLSLTTWFLKNVVGIVDTPALAERTLEVGLRERQAEDFDISRLEALSPDERKRTVLIAQDAFTTYYEPNVALSVFDLLKKLGKRPVFLPFRQNGKALHVKGFLGWFRKVARENADFYVRVAALDVPIVGIEPAVTLTYRDEYPKALGELGFEVKLLQEYLAKESEALKAVAQKGQSDGYRLFGHCTERTYEPKSQQLWKSVFRDAGMDLGLESTGCCGMCGVFGHEAEHYNESRGVFDMSWKKHLPEDSKARALTLATGHSCRSQVKRFEGFVPLHPAEALLQHLNS